MAIVSSLPENRSCALCDYFDVGGYCRHWQDRIPDEVQAAGCDDWDETVPF